MINSFTLHHGDCLETLRAMADDSVDSIVTDPPYGLSFMGKKWDYDVPAVEVWAECLRVLKPGGHLLAFAGTRTQHRMAVRIEDAGFEIRDMIAWVYGSGFPKSHNGDWGGTALKPALEPITMARKPLIGTVAANWEAHGTGALNIDGCRVATDDKLGGGAEKAETSAAFTNEGWRRPWMDDPAALEKQAAKIRENVAKSEALGRWPANLILSGEDEVVALFPVTKSGAMKAGTIRAAQDGPGSVCYGTYGGNATSAPIEASEGSAARFFYQVKNVCSAKAVTISPCNQKNVNAAEWSSNPSKQVEDSVQRLVAIAANLAGNPLSALISLFMIDTASELKLNGVTNTQTILSIAQKFWRESLLTSTQGTKENRVSDAALSAQTFTTMIIQSLLSIDGCADVATLGTIVTSLELGAKGCSEPPSRFMYCAKASKADRNEHVETHGHSNTHVTVKPTDLMAYLCRLVTPAGGVVLDPFMGSGSTGKAAMREGFRFIGCELSAEYLAIAHTRIEHERDRVEAARKAAAVAAAPVPQLDLFTP